MVSRTTLELMQLINALLVCEGQYQFVMRQLCGLQTPVLEPDVATVVLRTHALFTIT